MAFAASMTRLRPNEFLTTAFKEGFDELKKEHGAFFPMKSEVCVSLLSYLESVNELKGNSKYI